MKLSKQVGIYASLMILNACAFVSEIPVDRKVAVSDVIKSIRCEFHTAAKANMADHSWIKDWAGSFVVDLKVQQEEGATANATFNLPLTAGALSVAIVAGSTTTESRSAAFTFLENFDGTDPRTCVASATAAASESHLTGKIGLADWVDTIADSMEVAGINKNTNQIDYNLSFAIKPNGSVNPTFSMLPIGGADTVSGGVKLSASEEETHKVNITLKMREDRKPKSDPEAIAVVVVNEQPIPVVSAPESFSADPEAAERAREARKKEIERAKRGPAAAKRLPGQVDDATRRSLERGLGTNILRNLLDEVRE